MAGPRESSSQLTGRLLSAAATTNATLVKGGNGTIRTIIGYNAAATARYLKLYDKVTAPTVGTDTPKWTIYLPPSTAFAFDLEHYFGQGIGFGLTTGSADNDTGALTAGDVLGLNIGYL
jgi:hypothetical protein